MDHELTRRKFLKRGTLFGCSLAASPLVTPVSLAATPGENRLVVIVLRGGLDGLDLLRPWGDAGFAALRSKLAADRPDDLMLDDMYGLHPALAPLMPMWRAGELGFAQAVSTPYRDKRSHFDGQDILEAGTQGLGQGGARDGWLNRLLQGMDGADVRTAYAIGIDPMLLSRGAAPVSSWTPEVDMVLSAPGLALMQGMYEGDPDMAAALREAVALAGSDGDAAIFEAADGDMMQALTDDMRSAGARAGKRHVQVAEFAARQLAADARIACFSIGGWDSHRNQRKTLNGPMGRLADSLIALKDGVGAVNWSRTTVVAMTEFGRTVRENGTQGTDHGTGGTMLLAGGALRGGTVHGQWPGLDEADLYQRRDLMPMDDVRRWAGWAIRSGFGIDKGYLERVVFPGLALGSDPGLLL